MTRRQQPGGPAGGLRPRTVRAVVLVVLATGVTLGLVDVVRSAGDPWGPGDVRTAAAQVGPFFDPADAEDLAERLAAATAVQGVCYGWDVAVSGTEAGRSSGSGAGVGIAASTGAECRDTVVFGAGITYTSESSDAEDTVSASVTSTLPGGSPTLQSLRDLGLAEEGDLLGDDVDLAVFDAVAALPRLVADAGLAPAVIATPEASAPPDVGALADDPGSDFLRTAGWWVLTGVVLVLAGILFAVAAVVTGRATAGRPAPGAPPPHR